MNRPEHQHLNVSPGTLYAGTNNRAGARRGCTYRVLGVAWCVRAMREEIVYEGIDGLDGGRLFVAPADVLASKMVPVGGGGDDGEGEAGGDAPPAAGVVGEGDVPPAVGVPVAQGKEVDLTTKGTGL